MAESDADAYAPIADEFTATDTFTTARATKRTAWHKSRKQKMTGARAAPQNCGTRMFDLAKRHNGCKHEQRPGAKFYYNTRMWVKRDGRWQMLFSLNTQIE